MKNGVDLYQESSSGLESQDWACRNGRMGIGVQCVLYVPDTLKKSNLKPGLQIQSENCTLGSEAAEFTWSRPMFRSQEARSNSATRCEHLEMFRNVVSERIWIVAEGHSSLLF